MPAEHPPVSSRPLPWRAHTPQPDDPPPGEPDTPDVPPIGDPPPGPGEVPQSHPHPHPDPITRA